MRAEVFQQWRDALRDLTRRPTAVCKVGGLGMPFWVFGFDARTDAVGYLELATVWKPYTETAIECFGADRCMMESNFPLDGRWCGRTPVECAQARRPGLSANQKAALFQETAAPIDRIELPAT